MYIKLFVPSAGYQEVAACAWKRQIFTEPSRNQAIGVEPRLNYRR